MARTVIFTGGKTGPEQISKQWISGVDGIIAADSGLDVCRAWGYTADLLCGDFDSMADTGAVADFPTDAVIHHPVAKAWSDTELALHEAYRRNPECETILVGGNGGRSDHFYSLMKLYQTDVYPHIWLGEEQAAICVDADGKTTARLTVSGLQKGDTVSVFAVTVTGGEQGGNKNAWEGDGGRYEGSVLPGCQGSTSVHTLSDYRMESDTLVWPLQDVDWSTGAESLSNWLTENASTLHLTATCGRFLVFVPLHAQVQRQIV